jgi:NADP-dependent 3-hydroxy acid dehydrogenase YdfG
MKMQDLTGKVAVITGASSGIGENVSEAMKERREKLDALGAQDVAQALVDAFAQPANVLMEEILLRPVLQLAP